MAKKIHDMEEYFATCPKMKKIMDERIKWMKKMNKTCS